MDCRLWGCTKSDMTEAISGSSSKAKALLQAGPFGQNGLWSRGLAAPVCVLGRRRREVRTAFQERDPPRGGG